MNTAGNNWILMTGLALSLASATSSCAQYPNGQQPGYSQPGTNQPYDNQGSYGNQGSYNNQPGYGNQGGYNNQPNYGNQGGYNNQQGYGQQGSPDFYSNLSPYGQWVQTPEYGTVWIPNAGPDFQPYATNGHWVVTEYGNTWVSDYAWGWAPFHYGRWYQDRYRGWAWVPGNDWGPAWVSWRSGGGYYGWAPLGPGIGVNVNSIIPAPYWVFVPQIYITSPRLFSYCVPRPRVVNIYQNTTIINNVYQSNNRTYAYGPRREEIERVTRQSVPVYRIENAGRPGRDEVRGNNSVGIYRPDMSRGGRGDGRYDANSNTNPAYGRGDSRNNSTPNTGTYPGGNARGGAGTYPNGNTRGDVNTYPNAGSRGSGVTYPDGNSRGNGGGYSAGNQPATPADVSPSYPQRGNYGGMRGGRPDASPVQPAAPQPAPQQNQPYTPQADRQAQPSRDWGGRRGGAMQEAPAQANPQPQAQPQPQRGNYENRAESQPQAQPQPQRGGSEQRGGGQPQGGGEGSRGSRGPR